MTIASNTRILDDAASCIARVQSRVFIICLPIFLLSHMQHSQLSSITPRTVFPGFHGKFVHSDDMTMAYWDIDAGSLVPEHAHVHEQVVNVLEGELELTVDGTSRVLKAGDVVVIPSNVSHAAQAKTDCRVLDIFCPVREDYRL